MSEKYLTPSEVCSLLRISRKTLQRWCDERRVPFFRIGRTIRFREAAIVLLLTKTESIANPAVSA
jgi:excisionase family DNA binding protein